MTLLNTHKYCVTPPTSKDRGLKKIPTGIYDLEVAFTRIQIVTMFLT